MASKFNINKDTNFGGYGADAFTLDHKFKGKPVSSKSDGLPDFGLQGGFSGDGGNTWSNSNVSFDMMGNTGTSGTAKFLKPSLKNANITHDSTKKNQKGIMLSVDGVARWMNKDTLVKGTNTMLGMAAQVGPGSSGNISYLDNGKINWLDPANDHIVQGTNYANPGYARSVAQEAANKKRAADSHKLFEMTGGLIGKAKPVASNKGNVPSDASLGSGGSSTSHPNAAGGQYSIGGTSGGSTSSSSASGRGGRSNKGSRRSKAMVSQRQQWATSPLRQQADSIQGELGRGKIGISFSRVGYGNRMEVNNWAQTSKNVITDYYTKSGMVGWGETVNPEHAVVDPTVMKTVVDKSSGYMTGSTSCYKGKCSRATPRYVNTSTYKQVSVTEGMTEGDRLDLIYDRVIDKSKSNKKEYAKYYETDPEVEEYQYYSVLDKDFASYASYKKQLTNTIDDRSTNQQFIIDAMGSDTKTLDKKDRSSSLIPELETRYTELDDKANVLKDEVGNYNWQKKISQEQFGTDTIQGDSHISHVLDSYGGQVRGGGYYSQDVGKLVRKSKAYEDALESKIKQKQNEIDGIELDTTEDLTEYYTDKTDKEYGIANKKYLSKSLALTKEDRAELEYQRRAQGMGGNQEAQQYRTQTSRGRPSLKQKSKQSGQYKNKRTRGGKNNLGGLVI